MFDTFIERAGALYGLIPFSAATWLTLATLAFFVWLFAKASKNPRSSINWEHLIVDSQNDRASPFKLGYLIGVIVGTWIVVRFVDADKLTYDIFGMYLMYLLGGSSWNAFIKSKGGETPPDQPQQ